MNWFNMLKNEYNWGILNGSELQNYVGYGTITQAQFNQITNGQQTQQNSDSNASQTVARPAHSQLLHDQSQKNSNFNTVD